jgi:hypothetical protein
MADRRQGERRQGPGDRRQGLSDRRFGRRDAEPLGELEAALEASAVESPAAKTPQQAGPLSDDELGALGRHNSPLLEREDAWIHRRVEHIYLGPDVMLERRVTIDFTVPPSAHVAGVNAAGEPVTYVPISVLRKWPPVMKFDLRDEIGQRLPLLTTHQVAQVDSAALVALAEKANGGPLPGVLERRVQQIARHRSAPALRALHRVLSPRKEGSDFEVRQRLGNNQRFVDLATHMVNASVVWVPVAAEGGRRRVIKLCYSIPAENQLDLLRTLFAQLGWASVVFWFELPHIGDAASYHLHLEAQRFMRFTDARLLLPRPMAGAPPSATHTQWHNEHAHLHVAEMRMRSVGLATITMRVQRSGTVVGAWLATVGIALLQWAYALRADEILRHPLEAPALVLVTVPVILVAFVARPVPRLHAQPVLLGLRGLVNLSGVVSLAAAVAALASDSHSQTHTAWWITAIISTVIALAATLSVILPGGPPTGAHD